MYKLVCEIMGLKNCELETPGKKCSKNYINIFMYIVQVSAWNDSSEKWGAKFFRTKFCSVNNIKIYIYKLGHKNEGIQHTSTSQQLNCEHNKKKSFNMTTIKINFVTIHIISRFVPCSWRTIFFSASVNTTGNQFLILLLIIYK